MVSKDHTVLSSSSLFPILILVFTHAQCMRLRIEHFLLIIIFYPLLSFLVAAPLVCEGGPGPPSLANFFFLYLAKKII